MDQETFENVYDETTRSVALEGEFDLNELETIIVFLREKELFRKLAKA